VLLVALAAVAGYRYAQAGRARHIADVGGEMAALPAGDGGWVAWLEREGEDTRLLSLRRGGRETRVVLESPGMSGLAVAGGEAFVTRRRDAGRGRGAAEFLRVDLESGAAREVAALPWPAEQVVFDNGFLLWREYRESPLSEVPFVVAAAPVHVIRTRREGSGEMATVAVIAGGTKSRPGGVSLVGAAGGYGYWVERRREEGAGSTVIRRVALPQGRPETLVRERGLQEAVLVEEALLWTAPSLEAVDEHLYAAVKRLPFDSSEPEAVADWLEADGELLACDGLGYFRERRRLWVLGDARGEQRVHSLGPPTGVKARVVGDEEYVLMRTGSGLAVASRPLTWWARVGRTVRP